ncbi:TonB-dependent receptor [Massilia sp. Dwa41.01b]|uniref:TonB-dependent receptor n=1 Tax=unclassified Massilia TaxID=2609279 RepID=UPI0016022DF3|nr:MULTISPECIES: TonB-dependent receptor [unclassified Massilia]QNA88086.1 TonB-dependent receptor [Massilia sp. Dwa41.01b]QNA98995.1 TonB-dependent receptor [Massilia sp. Se16.2.3]
MITQKQIRLTKLALALSIALSASPAFAQNTTSAIGGRVAGADGKPVAGAQVTIRHAESGSVSTVTTDAEGRYVARGLRVGGPYTITMTKDGVAETYNNVFTNLAETASVDGTLGNVQVVKVTGQTVSNKFNSSNMGSGTSIGRAELVAQASIARSLSDYARNDPRLSQTDKERGEISAGGQNSRFNSITVDGVSISDTFGLEANGLPTNKQPISIDAIQSVQVNISNYDVTQKGYTGANINAVTKSGTNDWHGSVYHVYRDDRLVGDRFNETSGEYYQAPAFKEKTNGLTLGGPLIQDKLFVFVSAEDSTSSKASPTYGPLGSNLTNIGITPTLISGLQDIAKNTYGMDVGSSDIPGGAELTVEDRLLKVDWNISDNHRANFRWQKTKQNEPQFPGNSSSGIALTSYLYAEKKTTESSVAQVFSDWTQSFSTEVKLSRRDSGKSHDTNSRLPSMALQVGGALPAGTPTSVSGANRFLNFGTEASRQFNELDTTTWDAYAGATWLHGDHEVKGGADYTKNEIFNAFLQNVNGTYTFRCNNTAGLTSAQVDACVLEAFRQGRPSSYQAQLPATGYTLEQGAANWTLANTGLFLQDTWSVNPQLKLTYGVRYDRASTNDRPLRNDVVAAARVVGSVNATTGLITRDSGGFGVDNTATIDGDDLIQPRVGFNYRFDTKRATQLRGGFGLFGGAALNVWLGNPFANAGIATRVVGCGTGNFAACPGTGDPIFSANPDTQRALAGVTPAANVDVLQNGISQPSVWKANLAFEHELPWYGMVVSLEYMRTDTNKGIYFRQLNLGDPTRVGPDGRPLFWTAPGYNAACATGTTSITFNTSGACNGYRARALSNASFNNVLEVAKTKKGGGNLATLQLTNSRSRGLRWSAAYTYTDATEVSNLSSSTSGSNFGARAIFDPNEDVAANSAYLVKDRINASVSWEKAFFGTYKTIVGAFYEGRSGKPYSWTFNNDMNGDGVNGNDLMYIPSAFGSGEVVFRGDTTTNHANEQKFWDIVNSNHALRNSAGKVVDRNNTFAPWTNSIDMRITQEVPGLFKGHKGAIAIDFQNVGNMLNKKWGRINEISFASNGGASRNFVDYAGMQDGKYVYQVRDRVEDYTVRQVKGESQWALQVTARYEF